MGKTKFCFFDDYWVDFRVGTVRRWYEPSYEGFYRDANFSATGVARMQWCPDIDRYRLFYNVWPDIGQDAMHYLCLAESSDGIHFAPAKVNDRPEKAMQHVIADGSDGISLEHPSYDVSEKDPSKRFKCAATFYPNGIKETAYDGMIAGTSPDGINWTFDTGHLIHASTSDADNTILYNPYTEEYMLFLRAAYVDRRICYKTSRDLIHWSDSVCCLHPGAVYNSDALQVQLYGMVPSFVDGIFYGMVQRFYTSLTDMEFSKMWGYVETELYYSYDGMHYMPTTGRPVTQRPSAPDYGCTQLYLHTMTETKDGRDYIITGLGSRIIHGTQESNREFSELLHNEGYATVFFRIRKDGFCGIDGMGAGAKVITKCMEIEEPDLTFNINAGCGFVRFGIMEKNGGFIEGFSFDDCKRFTGDDTLIIPEWEGHKLDEILGRQVRIAVELNGAVLHAMSVTARPFIRKPQKSFALPDQIL